MNSKTIILGGIVGYGIYNEIKASAVKAARDEVRNEMRRSGMSPAYDDELAFYTPEVLAFQRAECTSASASASEYVGWRERLKKLEEANSPEKRKQERVMQLVALTTATVAILIYQLVVGF